MWLVCNLSFLSFAKSYEKLIQTFEGHIRRTLYAVKTRQPRVVVAIPKDGHFRQTEPSASWYGNSIEIRALHVWISPIYPLCSVPHGGGSLWGAVFPSALGEPL